MTVDVYSSTACTLGEGPLWHPERGQLFWFDILGKQLRTIENGEERVWTFDDYVSAAGWVDRDTLIMASANALWRFDISTGERTHLVDLEADNPVTRSNDGRADPWGGFWIGTMGVQAEPGAGAIYRYYRGELRKLVPDVTISNAICFAHDKSCAYYTDTDIGKIMRQPLSAADGWPEGSPSVFLDLGSEDFGVDGAVIDAEGCLVNARWGTSQVVRYAPDGTLLDTFDLPTSQTTCPAFGGADLTRLFVTSAAENLNTAPAGQTFVIDVPFKGLPEYQVIL
ncbi:MAG: SMP-30/gluconolactonase/LRE family protein [Rhodobacteraceae bacterium]|nr:SMP-30/gluconolactonase/LRE family protein [Paracoccaceae bacterium]